MHELKMKLGVFKREKINIIETDSPYFEGKGLPDRYGDTKIAMIPRSPTSVYVYWEIGEQKMEDMEKIYGEDALENSTPFLMLYRIEGNSEIFDREIKLPGNVCEWFIEDLAERKNYKVEIGVKINESHFVCFASSKPRYIY